MTKYIIKTKAGAKRIEQEDIVYADNLSDAKDIVRGRHKGAYKLEFIKTEKINSKYLERPKDKALMAPSSSGSSTKSMQKRMRKLSH